MGGKTDTENNVNYKINVIFKMNLRYIQSRSLLPLNLDLNTTHVAGQMKQADQCFTTCVYPVTP